MIQAHNTGSPNRLQDVPIDIKLRLSALWIATMFVYAYVDIFALMRADFLEGLLDGKIVDTPIEVGQWFLVATVAYIVPASLMVYLSLTLRPRINRWVNMIIAAFYIATVVASTIGEDWLYYFLGSAIEVVLLLMIVRLAWNWPAASKADRI